MAVTKNEQLTIVARIVAKEGKTALVKSELLKLIEVTKREKGCINYDLHQDNDDENVFLFHENWATKALWQSHMENEHLAQYQKATEGSIADFSINEMTVIG